MASAELTRILGCILHRHAASSCHLLHIIFIFQLQFPLSHSAPPPSPPSVPPSPCPSSSPPPPPPSPPPQPSLPPPAPSPATSRPPPPPPPSPPPPPPPPPPRTNASFSALFVLGDSTVDPGNNNYLRTLVRSNFQPYGIDFIDQVPTGRFCNGKLFTDFLASHWGIKETIPPFLDPTLTMEELLTGVSFACAGTGYDPLTAAIVNVISVPQQLQLMRQLFGRVETTVGPAMAADVMQNAVFLISAGTNDFLVNYYNLPLRRFTFTVDQYQNFLIDQLLGILEGLYRLGARRFIVAGISPLGCLPVEMTIDPADAFVRNCIESLNAVATSYNLKLENALRTIKQSGFSGAKLAYADTYYPMLDMMQNPDKYGFEEVKRGCCGTGLIEMGYSCNPYTPICPDRSSYLFWDAIHPTQKTYNILFNTVIPDIMSELT
ncbi:GDSL esterase/lipase At5g45960-like [Nymphaea colorata]|nr:GDSL esterase/lipase At5g45960-like [Nymphaea colorata]